MPQRSVEAFIEAFKAMEEQFRNSLGGHYIEGDFLANLEAMRKRKRIIKENYGRLCQYAKLRNLIQHSPKEKDMCIAIPSTNAVKTIRGILHELSTITQIKEVFNKNRPEVWLLTSKLTTALRKMREHDYSQIVVKDQEIYSILSRDGISCWLQDSLPFVEGSFKQVTIDSVIRFEEKAHCEYLSTSDDADLVNQIFQKTSPRVIAILTSKTGKADERPLGIITPWDLSSID